MRFVAILAAGVLLAGCGLSGQGGSGASGGASSSAGGANCKQGGIVTVAYQDFVDSLSPLDTPGNANMFVSVPMFDTLVAQIPGEREPQPDLATSWDISDDGLSYTFHLRPGVRFSNGDPLTANDVLFSMRQVIDPDADPNWGFLFSNVEGFKIVDASTLRMTMKAVDASVLWSLAVPAAAILPQKVYQQLGPDGFKESPVGTGPFMLSSFTPGQTLELVKNPYYWGESYLDGIVFKYLPDPTARALAIRSGEADIAQNVPFTQITQLTSDGSIVVPLQHVAVGWFVTLNNAVKPLDEKVVRQALNYATPRDVISKLVLSGMGTPMNAMMPMGTQFWDPSVPTYDYDLDKARALMARSSVPNGFDLDVVIQNTSTSSATLAILQSEWAKIGVNVKITPVDPSVLWDRLNKDDFQALMQDPWVYTSDVPDSNEMAQIFLAYSDDYRSWFSQYKSDEATSLVEQANSTTDPAERQALYTQLQSLTMDDAPSVALLWAPSTNANKAEVLGADIVATAWWRFEQICFRS